MIIGPEIGLDIGRNPTATTGVGACLMYVLTKKEQIVKNGKEDNQKDKDALK
jgi:hypothetical protein